MSKHTFTQISCPNCERQSGTILWESINAKSTPAIKEKLLKGTLFDFICPFCHETILLNYPFYYHDPDNKIIIFYAPDEETGEDALTKIEEFKETYDDYRYRIVAVQESVREKALIYDIGLDDSTIEVFKVFALYDLKHEMPFVDVDEVYFFINEETGAYCLQFFDDEAFVIEYDPEVYNKIIEDFADWVNDEELKQNYFGLNRIGLLRQLQDMEREIADKLEEAEEQMEKIEKEKDKKKKGKTYVS